jgi:hypothetical protein
MRQQDAIPALTTVMQTALREFLAMRGFVTSSRTLSITPSAKGSGVRDVSIAHDRYLADK